MISFIVIGKNEAKNILQCLNSITECIRINQLLQSEIIYVDSNSSDNSIDLAKSIPNIKIIEAITTINPAIARNIGANESKGDLLFFVDGDMVVNSTFISIILNENKDLKYNFVSGLIINKIYDNNGDLKKEIALSNTTQETNKEMSANGIFCIKRELWFLVNGMKSKFKKQQDADFVIRLYKKGIFLKRLTEIISWHITKDEYDLKSILNNFFKGNYLFRGVFYRTHFFSKIGLIKLFKNEKFGILFLVLISLLSCIVSPLVLLFYPLLILFRIASQKDFLFSEILNKFIFYALRDLSTFVGFMFFYPINIDNIKYKTL